MQNSRYWSGAVVLWVVQLLVAVAGVTTQFPMPVLAGNRETPIEGKGWVGRAQRAFRNLSENLLPFAVLVLVAHAAGVSNAATVMGAQIFFYARVAYAVVYIAGIPWLRTAVWTVGLVGIADDPEAARLRRTGRMELSTAYAEALAPVARCMMEEARIGPGQRVLDLGSGGGDMAWLAAQATGPNGFVLATDVALASMAGLAARVAAPGAPRTIELVVSAAEDLELEPGTFDVALARNCVMYFGDLGRALGNVRRALAHRRAIRGRRLRSTRGRAFSRHPDRGRPAQGTAARAATRVRAGVPRGCRGDWRRRCPRPGLRTCGNAQSTCDEATRVSQPRSRRCAGRPRYWRCCPRCRRNCARPPGTTSSAASGATKTCRGCTSPANR